MPRMQMEKRGSGPEKLATGQSINLAKLKRKAAFSWYSPGVPACAEAIGTQTNRTIASMATQDRQKRKTRREGAARRACASHPPRGWARLLEVWNLSLKIST